MKLRKVMACAAAAALAISALSVSASATMSVPADLSGKDPSADINSGSWGFQVYNTGNIKDGNKVPTNYGIDVTQIGGVKFFIGVPADAEFDPTLGEAFGGAVAFSCNNSKTSDNEVGTMTPADAAAYNWQTYEWWGWNDGTTDTTDYEKPIACVANGDGTYTLDAPIGDYVLQNEGCCIQIFLQEWSTAALFATMEVYGAQLYDRSGNVLINYDALGNPDVTNYWDNGYVADLSYSKVAPSEVAAKYAELNGTDAAAPSDADADASADAASDTDAAATDAAANAGATADAGAANADKAGNEKTNSDTGVESVAVVAGLAVLAAGAVIVAKKRK